MKSIQLLVLPREVESQRDSKQPVEEHEAGADRLAFHIIWAIALGKHASAENRTALTDKIEDHDAHSSSRIGALVVEDPGKDVGDGGKDTRGSQKYSEVARPDAVARRKKNVAYASHAREEKDHQTSLLKPVGNPGCEDGEEE